MKVIISTVDVQPYRFVNLKVIHVDVQLYRHAYPLRSPRRGGWSAAWRRCAASPRSACRRGGWRIDRSRCARRSGRSTGSVNRERKRWHVSRTVADNFIQNSVYLLHPTLETLVLLHWLGGLTVPAHRTPKETEQLISTFKFTQKHCKHTHKCWRLAILLCSLRNGIVTSLTWYVNYNGTMAKQKKTNQKPKTNKHTWQNTVWQEQGRMENNPAGLYDAATRNQEENVSQELKQITDVGTVNLCHEWRIQGGEHK